MTYDELTDDERTALLRMYWIVEDGIIGSCFQTENEEEADDWAWHLSQTKYGEVVTLYRWDECTGGLEYIADFVDKDFPMNILSKGKWKFEMKTTPWYVVDVDGVWQESFQARSKKEALYRFDRWVALMRGMGNREGTAVLREDKMVRSESKFGEILDVRELGSDANGYYELSESPRKHRSIDRPDYPVEAER